MIAASLLLVGALLAQPPADVKPGIAPSTPPAAAAPADAAPLVCEATVNAPPDEVWKVWTTPEGFKLLGVAKVDIDLRVGGLIRSSYDPKTELDGEGAIHNQIIAFEPVRMFAFRIAKPPKGFPFMQAYKSTWSVATMTDLGDGRTHVRLATMGYTDDAESQAMRKFFKNGNEWTLKKLQSHFDSAARPAAASTAHADQPLAPLDCQVVVNAPRRDVFNAYTTSEGWKQFMGVQSRIEPKVGGAFEVYFMDTAPAGARGSDGCTVLSLIPGEMISYTWNAPPTLPFARAHPNWVVVTFEEVSARATRVRLRHLGFAELATEFPDHAEEFKTSRGHFVTAWPMVLGRLKQHFEPAADAPKPAPPSGV